MEFGAAKIIPALITILSGTAIYWYFSRNKRTVPKKWEAVGTVAKILMYPLRGGRRVELDSAICTKRGLIKPEIGSKFQFKDRNINCYKEDDLDYYCSYPKMQLVEATAIDENHFILSAPDTPSLRVKIPDAIFDHQKDGQVLTWKNEYIRKYDCGDDAAKWISLHNTGKESGLRLGFFDDKFQKNVEEENKKGLKVYPKLKNKAGGLFAAISSYMVVNQASVDDISGKLPDENITANNFRPNILVQDKNLLPYVEDHWKWIKIGDVILYAVKPCLRCNVTTVNPETGVPSANREPIKTLRKQRKLRDVLNITYEGVQPVFGNLMGLEHEGHIKLGDTVFVGK